MSLSVDGIRRRVSRLFIRTVLTGSSVQLARTVRYLPLRCLDGKITRQGMGEKPIAFLTVYPV